MSFNRLTPETAKDVFNAILEMSPDDLNEICIEFDRVLDDLRNQDFFGTEGQNDPRGDPR